MRSGLPGPFAAVTAHRVGAIMLGLMLALGGLEIVLRAASAALRPEPPVIAATGPDNEIRILCIGESTTAGLWPGLLQTSLNRKRPDLQIRIINNGVVGARTGDIRAQLPRWLDRARPQIAITMLGINDEGNVLVYPRSDLRSRLVDHSRAAKLLALLWRSTFGVGGSPDTPPPTAPIANAQWDPTMRAAIDRHIARRAEALAAFRYSVLFETQPALLEIDPATPAYHVGWLVDGLIKNERPEQMNEFFSRELDLAKSGDMTSVERSVAITAWGRGHGNAFDTLRMLTSQKHLDGDVTGEGRAIIEALRNPTVAGPALVRYAWFLNVMDRRAEAAATLRQAQENLPDDYCWSLALAEISFRIGAFEDACDLYNKALELRPELPKRHEETIIGWLARASAAAGREEEARALRDRLDRMGLERFREYTRFNYSQIVDLLRERGITVIAMQYPTLSVEALRRILDERDDVLYLENRDNFEQALRDLPYEAVFSDSFAGSFGHCTRSGEELIAVNVANAVTELVGRGSTGEPASLDSLRHPRHTD